MKSWQKRLLRVLVAIAGIMATLQAFPVDALDWVQHIGGWLGIIIAAGWSNSDSIGAKK